MRVGKNRSRSQQSNHSEHYVNVPKAVHSASEFRRNRKECFSYTYKAKNLNLNNGDGFSTYTSLDSRLVIIEVVQRFQSKNSLTEITTSSGKKTNQISMHALVYILQACFYQIFHLPLFSKLLYCANSIEMLVPRGQDITT